MTRVGMGTTCDPSPDGARAGLDASHASKSITAWREKKPSYKGKLSRICRGTFSLRLILLGLCVFQYDPTEHISLSFLGVLVTDLSVGAPPAQRHHFVFFQVLREAIFGVDLEGTWCQAGEEDRDEATLLRKVNRQDHIQ